MNCVYSTAVYEICKMQIFSFEFFLKLFQLNVNIVIVLCKVNGHPSMTL